jgi:integration host factor subunit beta
MLKSEIIEKLQIKNNNLSNYDVELILKIFFKKIISSLNEGNTIEIRGFGTFKKKINREKKVRNPKNNQTLFKDQTYKLHFKIGKTLHKKLNNISSEDDK